MGILIKLTDVAIDKITTIHQRIIRGDNSPLLQKQVRHLYRIMAFHASKDINSVTINVAGNTHVSDNLIYGSTVNPLSSYFNLWNKIDLTNPDT